MTRKRFKKLLMSMTYRGRCIYSRNDAEDYCNNIVNYKMCYMDVYVGLLSY